MAGCLTLCRAYAKPPVTSSVWMKPNQNGGIQVMEATTRAVPATHSTRFRSVRRPGLRFATWASSPMKLVAAIKNQVVPMIGKANLAMLTFAGPDRIVQNPKTSSSETTTMTLPRTALDEIRSNGLKAASANVVAMAAPSVEVPMM